MVWIKATYQFASFFSYRIPDFSSQYALSSILPGPSTIKLAVVSTAIETAGDIHYGKEIFNIVKNVKIKIELPSRVALSNVLIKRLKKKKGEIAFETTFGIRGYVHIPESLNIYIDVPENKNSDIKNLMKKIRYFGTSDSLVYCYEVDEKIPSSNAISPVESLEKENIGNILIIQVKDLDPNVNFENINIFCKSKKRKQKDVFLRKFYLIPILRQQQGKNWIVYEFA